MYSQDIASSVIILAPKDMLLVNFEGNDYILPQCMEKQSYVRILQLIKRMAASIVKNYEVCESFHHITNTVGPLCLSEWDLTEEDLGNLNSKRNQICNMVIPKLWEQWIFLHCSLEIFSAIKNATKDYYEKAKIKRSIHKKLYKTFRLESLKQKYTHDGKTMELTEKQLEKFEDLVSRCLESIEKVDCLIYELEDLSKVTDAVYRKGVVESFHRSMDSYLHTD